LPRQLSGVQQPRLLRLGAAEIDPKRTSPAVGGNTVIE
jgi:hypothetical protein